jgi:hypothetical protein
VTHPLRSRPGLRTAARLAATLTALAAVSAGVIAAQSSEGPALGLAADALRADRSSNSDPTSNPDPASNPDPRVADRTDLPGLQAAQGSAQARARAEELAAQRAQAAARAARERAAAAARSALRDPRGTARLMLADHGWSGSQFSCLDALWTKESGWNPRARNPSSGAFGIPQSLPAGKMSSAGADWATNPATQIRWGLTYIKDVYGSPCGAWAHSRATNWY